MAAEETLWRVWRSDWKTWKLVRAPDSDSVYRGFEKKYRERITRVVEVHKTSEMTGGEVR